MKNIVNIILYMPLIALFMGCTDFLDVNTSKDSPTTVTVDQALPVACFYTAWQSFDHSEYGVYLSQALTTPSKDQTGGSRLAYSEGWDFLQMNRHPQWRRHFYDLGANINEMIRAAEKIDSKNFILIGRSIMLQSTMLTTDAFGEMPRSNAYTSTSPTYDSQEEIYDWMFQEADELVALYSNDEWVNNINNIPISEKMDRIYKGDMKKWEVFTKALRARLWLRKLPNWENNPTVCNKIVAMVDEVLNDTNWEEPRYYFPGGTNEQNCPWGPSRPIINAWESRPNRLATSIPSKFFAYGILGAYESSNTVRRYAIDPRAERIMAPRADDKNATHLRWLECNIGMETSMKVTYYPDLYPANNPYTKNNSFIALITEEELLFIKAEAQYWAGDKAGAYNTTMKAVLHNFDRYDIKEPVAAIDGNNAVNRYKAFFDIRLPGETLFTIADLMQQKYIAMYLQPEQWNDMRRYNYSSGTNGIRYDGVEVYTVTAIFNGRGTTIPTIANCDAKYSLRRPFNLYEAFWVTSEDSGQNAELSPNAWLQRLNPDPETEEKYNQKELERLGAFKNFEWLRKRMIWAHNISGKATCNDQTEWK